MRRGVIVLALAVFGGSIVSAVGPAHAVGGHTAIVCAPEGHVKLLKDLDVDENAPSNRLELKLATNSGQGYFKFAGDAAFTCAGEVENNNVTTPVAGKGTVSATGPFGNWTNPAPGGDTCIIGRSTGGFGSSAPLSSQFTVTFNQLVGSGLSFTGNFNFIRLGTAVAILGSTNTTPVATVTGFFQFLPPPADDLGNSQSCFGNAPPISTNGVSYAAIVGEAQANA